MQHPSDKSPFAEVAERLHANGYSPIPIMPGTKTPGMIINDEWRLAKGWTKYCVEQASDFQMGMWLKWPNAGVGLACGQGLIAVDIDNEDCLQAIVDALPPCRAIKKGRKGMTLFYRGDTTKIRSRNYRTHERIGLVDLLAEGKQTVMPPTIHPDTSEPYYWITDETLEILTLEDLTAVPDDLQDIIADKLRPYGYEPDRDRPDEYVPTGPFESSEAQVSDFFRKLNEDALANISAWAPDLGLPKGRFHGRVYRAVAFWRPSSSGRDMSKRSPNLSISPGGIEDFGDGKTYTALNVVMRARDLDDSQLEHAVVWLGERLGYDFGVHIDLRTSGKTKQLALATEMEPDLASRADVEIISSGDETLPVAHEPLPPPTNAELENLCHVPGLVGEIVDWIVGTSTNPCATLALGPTLCFLGTLAGRFTAGPTNLRTNLYVLGLAESGFGKDHARKKISALMTDSGFDIFRGPESFLSDSGLRKRIEQQPALYCQIDEFGEFVGKMMDKRAGTHQSAIRQMLMKLYSNSADVYSGAASAMDPGTTIYNPCLSIYGTTTPHDFWPSMSGKGVADGFLPRWLVFSVAGSRPPEVEPIYADATPHHLIEGCRSLADLARKDQGNLVDAKRGRVQPRLARYGAGAKELCKEWRAEFDRRSREVPTELSSLYTRGMENALKIAHIVALGIDPEDTIITTDLLNWGATVADYSVRTCIDQVKDRLASSDQQEQYLYVKRIIKGAGAAGITNTALKRSINGLFDTRRMEDILKQLQGAEEVEIRHPPAASRAGRPPSSRWHYKGD